MVKNEEKILKRCLEAVANVVDCFCICDTGSTDNTVNIANEFLETHTGCVTVVPWKNFGFNRTASFDNAQKYVRSELKWDLNDTYGLLLDADMIFVSGKLKEQQLTKEGYCFLQLNGGLEYSNCRFVRMDYPWKCIGVTHEYWAGPTETLPKDICYIDDRNDGGCKHDKFQRDRKLLEEGLEEEPTNVRYMFYLGQTYNCLGMLQKSNQMYKKRIKAGGWDQEIWYSHYMIGQNYLHLKNIPKFEEWMLRAHEYRPSRSEPIAKLAEYFRIISQHYKSYHYIRIGQSIPKTSDALFVESDVYSGKFDYEASIIDYYVHSDKKIALRDSFNCLRKTSHYFTNIVSNLKFYAMSIASDVTMLNLLPLPFGSEFRPSAISVFKYPFANVRYVNYTIQPDKGYVTPSGVVDTKNAYVNLETNEFVAMKDVPPLFNSHIRGLEDVRVSVYKDKLYFTATSYKEFIYDKISIVHGEYDSANGEFVNYIGIESPFNHMCEKNWVCFPETNHYIYSWSPLRIGIIEGNKFNTKITYNTLPIFQHMRGSAAPVKFGDKWMVLVHFIEDSTPRKYYHCFVKLDKAYSPESISLPFYFCENSIEFCVSCIKQDDNTIVCFTSLNDCDPRKVTIPLSNLEWLSV